ncbi:MAG: circadian clock KaiB family protein [Gammaproteobacteria bacterium]|nr:circadian clock KaiB family protein [Gammaproteobacteria bacterium]
MKPKIKLRLFISRNSQAAERARDNLKAVCDDPAVKRRHDIELEIIDVDESPKLTAGDNVLVTPTLLKTLPEPVRRMVGDLSNEQDIFVTLDIDPPAGAEGRSSKTSTNRRSS